MYSTSNQNYGNYYKLLQQKQSTRKYSNNSSIAQQSIKKIGLSNIGNSCFMNCIFQCIFNQQETNQFLKDIGHIDFTRASLLLQSFLVIWFKVTQAQIEPDIEDLKEFRDQLGKRCQNFNNSHQHDAVEFLQILLELLSQDIKSLFPSKRKLNALQLQNDTPWNIFSETQLSSLNIPYTGQILIRITCLACKHEELHYDYFCNLSLFIPQKTQKADVYQLLREYFRTETIDSQCKNCHHKSQSKKSSYLLKLPQVLVIQLKRYNFYKQLDQPLKELEIISIEATVDLKPICDQQDCKYALNSIVNHQGIIHSGHYTAFIKDYVKGNWFSYNDTRISELQNDFIQNELSSSRHSYVLLYHKI